MQIQKGLVKYKDRTDIVCTYGLTDDGKQYYFLDSTSIPNGDIIASTALVEAIDPVVVASSIGVIDPNGNVVIPFENRSIKAITPELLLVEKANSTTPSVVEANKLRSDPLAATKLVTTPATIKDNMNAKMGNNGRFVFNDQFSEATIYDINGKNLINNEYYSFIGLENNEALYFSKNTMSSPVEKYSLALGSMVEDAENSVSSEPLDVQNTEVTQATIDGAMAEQEAVDKKIVDGDITAASFENMAVNPDDAQVMVDNSIPSETVVVEGTDEVVPSTESVGEEMEKTDISVNEESGFNGFSPDDVAVDVSNTQVEVSSLPSAATEQNVVESEAPEVEESRNEVTEESSVDVVESPNVSTEESEEKKLDSYAPIEDAMELPIPTSSILSENDTKSDASENSLVALDFGDNINYSNVDDDSVLKSLIHEEEKNDVVEEAIGDFTKDLFDIDLETDIFADSTLHADRIVHDSYGESNLSLDTKDTIIEDVASTMTNLIKLNKSQKEKISAYEEKFEQVAETHKKVVEKAKSQVRDIETLKAKVKNYETIVTKLESKIQLLESKVHDQENLISSQSSELDALRPQVEGKKELARILADAQSLLDQE